MAELLDKEQSFQQIQKCFEVVHQNGDSLHYKKGYHTNCIDEMPKGTDELKLKLTINISWAFHMERKWTEEVEQSQPKVMLESEDCLGNARVYWMAIRRYWPEVQR